MGDYDSFESQIEGRYQKYQRKKKNYTNYTTHELIKKKNII